MSFYEERFNYLDNILKEIKGPDKEIMQTALKRQSVLAKPPLSLGRLEELSVKLSGMTGRIRNSLDKRYLIVFCSDNGVIEEGVSVSPEYVTLKQAENLVKGITGGAVLAKKFNCKLVVCDVGIAKDSNNIGLIRRKVSYGTKNMTKGPAMTKEETLEAVLTGFDIAVSIKREGCDVIGVGEMGIGNTTTASAVLSSLSLVPASSVTGRGGGLTDHMYENKISVIEKALMINRPDPCDVIDVLSKVGGLDIAAMTGAYLAAAYTRTPAMIDGFISAVAALCAFRLSSVSKEFMISSHRSCEPGFGIVMKELDMKPLLDLEMRLGEGSGCPLAMSLLDASCSIMNDMATFTEAGIDAAYLNDLYKETIKR